MRYWEFALTESQARKDFVTRQYKAALDALASSDQATSMGISSTEQLIDWFYNLDPSSNKKYFSWIVDRVVSKTATETLSSIQGVKDLLTNFEAALRTQQQAGFSVLDSNIGKYRSLSALDAAIQQVGSSKEADDLAEYNQARSESTMLHEDPTWVVAIPQTQQAAMYWTRGTTQCINWGDPEGLHPTRENHFHKFPGTYVIHNRRDPKKIIGIHFNTGQIKNWKNNDIPRERWGRIGPFLSKIVAYHEKKLLTDEGTRVDDLIEYADFYIQGRWPEPDRARVENMIIESGVINKIATYAVNCIKDRWPEAEPKIIEYGNADLIVWYARKCIKGRWIEVENKIASSQNVYSIIDYATYCIKDRWPEPDRARVENKIIESRYPVLIVEYAAECIHGRWPEPDRARVENIIIERRWINAIVDYAKRCIKGRWPEAEDVIFRHGDGYDQEYRELVQQRSQGDGAQ